MTTASEPLVLAVDDEPGLTRLLKLELTEQGFRVITVNDARIAIDEIEKHRPDILLLDVLMPGLTGHELLREVRERWTMPVIFLTARDRDIDKVRGLEMGADDYVVKPFSADELAARIRAVLRRVQGTGGPEPVIVCGNVTIDLESRIVQKAGEPVALTRTEWLLLQFLASNAGKVVLNAEILARVWGPEYRDDLQYLRVWVSRLRAKIEDDPSNPTVVKTLPGIGYQLLFDERRAPGAAA